MIRRHWKGMALLLVLIAAAVCLFHAPKPERSLRNLATRVAPVTLGDDYFWVSNTSLLMFSPYLRSVPIQCLDTVSGHMTPCTSANRILNKTWTVGQNCWLECPSPDGKWLLGRWYGHGKAAENCHRFEQGENSLLAAGTIRSLWICLAPRQQPVDACNTLNIP